ncbi:Clp protease N-terminal domain-containing protein [Rhodococcus sp. ACS1]|uniref:Clp protease N-terminal domain-containing protein n=1 Tax=Rhodococcus sp. ACS1 TaxID=2028570 RepID=UPI00211C218A|nr:Clp protease N-terminal domain-containing protein [Rhodococcus sp. ACS1]
MSAHRRAPPRPPGTSRTRAKTKKVLEGSLRQTALLGHEEIGTDHLLPALLDDPASTGARILTDLAPLPISEMREHLRRELAHRPTPGPAHRIPIRLSADEYTRAHAAARTAGQNLETWIHDRITDALKQPWGPTAECRQKRHSHQTIRGEPIRSPAPNPMVYQQSKREPTIGFTPEQRGTPWAAECRRS